MQSWRQARRGADGWIGGAAGVGRALCGTALPVGGGGEDNRVMDSGADESAWREELSESPSLAPRRRQRRAAETLKELRRLGSGRAPWGTIGLEVNKHGHLGEALGGVFDGIDGNVQAL